MQASVAAGLQSLAALAAPAAADAFSDAAKAKVASLISETPDGVTTFTKEQVGSQFKEAQAKVVRWMILDDSVRIDGRDLKTVRKIVVEAGILPRTHGSALFTRGETQALVVTTLGTGDDEQFIDSLEGTYKETFLLHYNFPPYSTGETGRVGSPKRREIGHGACQSLRDQQYDSRVGDEWTLRMSADGGEMAGSGRGKFEM